MAEPLPYVEEDANLNKKAPRGKIQVHHSIQLWNDNKFWKQWTYSMFQSKSDLYSNGVSMNDLYAEIAKHMGMSVWQLYDGMFDVKLMCAF